MWLALAILFACTTVAVHLWWKRRSADQGAEIIKLQQELRESRSLLDSNLAQGRAHQQALFNSMVEGVLLLNSEGLVQTTNRSLARLFSLERDIRGLTIMEAFRSHELLEVVERAQKEGQVHDFELTIPGIHQTRYVEVNAASVRRPGHPRDEIILIFHDFTRIKQLEGMRASMPPRISPRIGCCILPRMP